MPFNKEFAISKLEDVVMHLEHAHREVEAVFDETGKAEWSKGLSQISNSKQSLEKTLMDVEFAIYLLKKGTV